MANQLTNDGLTVGSGTITNFITNFGSVVSGNGYATLTVPSSETRMPSSLNVGGSGVFCISGTYNGPGCPSIILPSSGVYVYSMRRSQGVYNETSESEQRKIVSGSIKLSSYNPTSGGSTILSGVDGEIGQSTMHKAWGGGIIRIC